MLVADAVDEPGGKADCGTDVSDVYALVVGIESEGLAAEGVAELSSTGRLLVLPTVSISAAHWSVFSQCWPAAQHIDPHGVSSNPRSHFNDEVGGLWKPPQKPNLTLWGMTMLPQRS